MSRTNLPIPVHLKTKINNDDFTRYINEWLKDIFTNTKILGFQTKVSSLLKIAVRNSIEASSTFQALKNPALLQAEFGLSDGSYADQVADYVTNMVNITMLEMPNTSGGKFRMSLSISFGDIDYTSLLAQPFAKYTSYNDKDEETVIPWLEWLLLRGTEPILQDWMIIYPGRARQVKSSRTGYALMRPITKGGKSWSVPPEYAGTATDNFITRAINDVQLWFAQNLEKEIQNLFK